MVTIDQQLARLACDALAHAKTAEESARSAWGMSTADDATNAAVRHLVNAVSALRNVVELTLQPSAPDDQHGTCTRWVLGIGVHAGAVQITAHDGHVTTIPADKFADLARAWLAYVGTDPVSLAIDEHERARKIGAVAALDRVLAEQAEDPATPWPHVIASVRASLDARWTP